MLVTINTDASHHWDLKIGAFAFWMTCNQGRHFAAGALKGKIVHSHEAEFKAIVNALYFLIHKSGWTGITKAVFNTDSEQTLLMIQGKRRSQWAKPLKEQFDKLVKKSGIQVEVRKVKAHSGTEEKRQWVNDWCDREAKRAIMQLRNGVKK